MTTDIPDILKRADRFLIVTHVNPDGDALGSMLGMHLALRDMGKKSWAMLKDSFPERYAFLPGRDSVCTSPESLNGRPDWIVSLDVASEGRISADVDLIRRTATLINIDHHPTNNGFGDINLIQTEATSTAELVFTVLRRAGYAPSPEVGKCLYTGLITDTGCFRFAGVNSDTLRLASDILASGFDSYDVTRHIYEEYPLRRMELERLLLERIRILLEGRLVMSTFYEDDFKRLGASVSESEDLVNRLRENSGVEVGVLLTQISDEVCRASLRSKGRVDVARIAATLGGGGHKNAAGLRSTLPLQALQAEIVRCVADALQ
ncbi:MAG: bifunctional oligoribonuclease/PAP phosphatase NrnA [Desulfomonilaceae bacterium]|nr:bifunctional oligoribonuclease/PAP phosphatase NrnA [Desulfomonilaceae bacterium]